MKGPILQHYFNGTDVFVPEAVADAIATEFRKLGTQEKQVGIKERFNRAQRNLFAGLAGKLDQEEIDALKKELGDLLPEGILIPYQYTQPELVEETKSLDSLPPTKDKSNSGTVIAPWPFSWPSFWFFGSQQELSFADFIAALKLSPNQTEFTSKQIQKIKSTKLKLSAAQLDNLENAFPRDTKDILKQRFKEHLFEQDLLEPAVAKKVLDVAKLNRCGAWKKKEDDVNATLYTQASYLFRILRWTISFTLSNVIKSLLSEKFDPVKDDIVFSVPQKAVLQDINRGLSGQDRIQKIGSFKRVFKTEFVKKKLDESKSVSADDLAKIDISIDREFSGGSERSARSEGRRAKQTRSEATRVRRSQSMHLEKTGTPIPTNKLEVKQELKKEKADSISPTFSAESSAQQRIASAEEEKIKEEKKLEDSKIKLKVATEKAKEALVIASALFAETDKIGLEAKNYKVLAKELEELSSTPLKDEPSLITVHASILSKRATSLIESLKSLDKLKPTQNALLAKKDIYASTRATADAQVAEAKKLMSNADAELKETDEFKLVSKYISRLQQIKELTLDQGERKSNIEQNTNKFSEACIRVQSDISHLQDALLPASQKLNAAKRAAELKLVAPIEAEAKAFADKMAVIGDEITRIKNIIEDSKTAIPEKLTANLQALDQSPYKTLGFDLGLLTAIELKNIENQPLAKKYEKYCAPLPQLITSFVFWARQFVNNRIETKPEIEKEADKQYENAVELVNVFLTELLKTSASIIEAKKSKILAAAQSGSATDSASPTLVARKQPDATDASRSLEPTSRILPDSRALGVEIPIALPVSKESKTQSPFFSGGFSLFAGTSSSQTSADKKKPEDKDEHTALIDLLDSNYPEDKRDRNEFFELLAGHLEVSKGNPKEAIAGFRLKKKVENTTAPLAKKFAEAAELAGGVLRMFGAATAKEETVHVPSVQCSVPYQNAKDYFLNLKYEDQVAALSKFINYLNEHASNGNQEIDQLEDLFGRTGFQYSSTLPEKI